MPSIGTIQAGDGGPGGNGGGSGGPGGSLHVNIGPQDSAIKHYLIPRNVPSAAYNSFQRQHTHGCLPGTRTGILETVTKWFDKDDGPPIFWLGWPAGSGKSTIARTVAEDYDKGVFKGKLAATFFFSRDDPDRRKADNVVLSLAYQLCESVQPTRALMDATLHATPSLPAKELKEQFTQLIYNPVCTSKPPIPRMLVVIDALDECEDKDQIKSLIGIIANACREPSFPLRFLLTVRHKYISAEPKDSPLVEHADLEIWKADADIRNFFEDKFRGILDDNETFMRDISRSWPPTEDLEKLVEKSGGLFIWAETVVKFISGSSDKEDEVQELLPQDRLVIALETPPGLGSLYQQVFQKAHTTKNFNRVIRGIMFLRTPFTIEELGLLFDLRSGDIRLAVTGLDSILNIPSDNDQAIRPFHASLHDFLTDSDRSTEYLAAGHMSMLEHCLRVITDGHQEEASGRRVMNYAWTSWGHHLYGVLSNGGEDNLLYPEFFTPFAEHLRRLVSQGFDLWFDTIYSCLVETRFDLDIALMAFRRLPGSPNNLVHILDDVKIRMHHKVELRNLQVGDVIEGHQRHTMTFYPALRA